MYTQFFLNGFIVPKWLDNMSVALVNDVTVVAWGHQAHESILAYIQ